MLDYANAPADRYLNLIVNKKKTGLDLFRYQQTQDSSGRITAWNYMLDGVNPWMGQTPAYDMVDRLTRLLWQPGGKEVPGT